LVLAPSAPRSLLAFFRKISSIGYIQLLVLNNFCPKTNVASLASEPLIVLQHQALKFQIFLIACEGTAFDLFLRILANVPFTFTKKKESSFFPLTNAKSRSGSTVCKETGCDLFPSAVLVLDVNEDCPVIA
jgi:hypothetical protein